MNGASASGRNHALSRNGRATRRTLRKRRANELPATGYIRAMFKDAALARELERTEGVIAASFADARRHVLPAQHSEWRDVGGAIAIYAGADSPMTQTFGLGMTEPETPAHLDALEGFFCEHGVATSSLLDRHRAWLDVATQCGASRLRDRVHAHEVAASCAVTARGIVPARR